MKVIHKNHDGVSTFLAFALLPLSGFATDIYVPSLPSMAQELHVTNSAVQLSLILFMVSSGVSQFFVGSLLDSFGRFRINILSLLVFSMASFAIALFPNIYLIYGMRIVQGITTSLIVVGKRAYFLDLYSGERLKHYTSLFSIIWATGPIIAPFVGGFLQTAFDWHANFYFLGGTTIVLLVLELIYSGETLHVFAPFHGKTIMGIYGNMLKTPDFRYGLVIIGLAYAILLIYGLTSPFIIQHVFHYSAEVTGYSSLASGLSLLAGGLISKALLKRPFTRKLTTALTIQAVVAVLMIVAAVLFTSNIYTLVGFTIGVHLMGGFIFNNVYAYCLTRFSKNAGIASGLAGGCLFIICAFSSYGLANLISVQNQARLGVAYLILIVLEVLFFGFFIRAKAEREQKEVLQAAA